MKTNPFAVPIFCDVLPMNRVLLVAYRGVKVWVSVVLAIVKEINVVVNIGPLCFCTSFCTNTIFMAANNKSLK
jgi:hypothetical protein